MARPGRPTPPPAPADATTYAMYHPAAALRQGSLKETMLDGHGELPDVLIERRASVAAGTGSAARP